jgi:hypothetical protein
MHSSGEAKFITGRFAVCSRGKSPYPLYFFPFLSLTYAFSYDFREDDIKERRLSITVIQILY